MLHWPGRVLVPLFRQSKHFFCTNPVERRDFYKQRAPDCSLPTSAGPAAASRILLSDGSARDVHRVAGFYHEIQQENL